MPEPMPLPPAAEAFLRTHIIPADREEARADLKAILETETQPTFRFRALTAQVGEAWIPLAWFIDIGPVIAGLVEQARAAERERAAGHLEATAARIRGDRKRVPQADEHVASVLEGEAEKIRRGE